MLFVNHQANLFVQIRLWQFTTTDGTRSSDSKDLSLLNDNMRQENIGTDIHICILYMFVCAVCVWLDSTLKRESNFESPGDNKLSASVETRVQAWASQAPTRQLDECPLKIRLLCESNICTISLSLFYMGFVLFYYTQSQSDIMYYVPNTETSALSRNKHRTPINKWLLYQTQRPNHILLNTSHKAPQYFMCSTEGTFKLPKPLARMDIIWPCLLIMHYNVTLQYTLSVLSVND